MLTPRGGCQPSERIVRTPPGGQGCFANTLDGIKFSSANHPLLDGPRWNRDRGRCDVPRYRNVSFARPK